MDSKDTPSDSTPGSWNTPLAANKTRTVPAGLSIATQDMGSMPQLGPDAAGSGSGQHVMTQPGTDPSLLQDCERVEALFRQRAFIS